MDKSLKAAIEYHLKSKVLDSFEDFLDELLLLLHDEEYQPTRHYRDKGCDGILFDDTIVNMYAPEKYDKYNFEKKFKEDFKKYKDHWRNDYPNLLICYNGEFTSENIIFLDNLEPGFKIKKKGFKQIIKEIEKLKWPKLRRLITNSLNISDTYIIYDVINKFIEDLINSKEIDISGKKLNESKSPAYIPDKIEINFEENEIEMVNIEYELRYPTIKKIQNLLNDYDDMDKYSLKLKIVTKFSTLTGTFYQKIDELTSILCGNKYNDDMYSDYTKSLIFYIFELCLIGIKVENE